MVEGSSPPVLVVVDSVQTMRSSASSSAAGSVGQIRDSTALFVQLAKLTGRHLCHLYELIRSTCRVIIQYSVYYCHYHTTTTTTTIYTTTTIPTQAARCCWPGM